MIAAAFAGDLARQSVLEPSSPGLNTLRYGADVEVARDTVPGCLSEHGAMLKRREKEPEGSVVTGGEAAVGRAVGIVV